MKEPTKEQYDILICGGGLAGLTLARQLRKEVPRADIVVIEKTRRPLPPGGFKVGESTVEGAAFYLAEILDLRAELDRAHTRKNGPRFFTGGGEIPLVERPEIGAAGFPRMPSWQIDRGLLEQKLRDDLQKQGVDLLEGYVLREITPTTMVGTMHEIQVESTETGRTTTLRGLWLIDALGRRRKLQRLLGHDRENTHRASAAWFHFDFALDVNDLAAPGPWHERDPEGIRFRSTNFMTGEGYWTWLVVLKSGFTSFGIVTDETLHPFKNYGSYEKALDWLRVHEPLLAERFSRERPRKFRGLRDFSYSSARVFDQSRWACVGDSGIFLDPLYSPGIDFIGLSNCMTTSMIKRDFLGKLNVEHVEQFNRVYLAMAEGLLETFRGNYRAFGKTEVFKAKLYWDTLFYWSFFAPILIFRLCDEPERLLEAPLFRQYLDLEQDMQAFFRRWAKIAPAVHRPEYTPYPPRGSLLTDLHVRLMENNNPEQALARMGEHLELCREAALQIRERAGIEAPSNGPSAPSTEAPGRPHELSMKLEFSYYHGELDENAHRASRMLLDSVSRAPSR